MKNIFLPIFIGLTLTVFTTCSAQVNPLDQVTFQGNIYEAKDLSAIAYTDNFLVVGSDEGTQIQILTRTNGQTYVAQENPITLFESDREVDIEGIARNGETFYVIGSHSLKREKADKDTYKKNRKRIAEVPKDEVEARKNLFRLTLDLNTGAVKHQDKPINLISTISEDDVLSRFANIPSKENGIDIEGIAVDDQTLYIGFRGPVLRLDYVPIMVTTYDAPSEYELRFVKLDGRGIRDIVKVDKGFLILAGPVADLGSFQIYHWNGKDALEGKGGKGGRVELLGEIPTPPEGKAEGITLISEMGSDYTVLIIYDGINGGHPTRFQIPKPKNLSP